MSRSAISALRPGGRRLREPATIEAARHQECPGVILQTEAGRSAGSIGDAGRLGLAQRSVPPLFAWGRPAGLSAFVELGSKGDEPLNKRADFRDDRAQAHDLDALSV